eukprot:Selendium_serpulae@DN1639_c0_g1_i1.p1
MTASSGNTTCDFEGEVTYQTEVCNTEPDRQCDCNIQCGGNGTEIRTRAMLQRSNYYRHDNGTIEYYPCETPEGELIDPYDYEQLEEELAEYRVCETPPCPVECVYGAWSEYFPPFCACGENTTPMTRVREIVQHGAHGGVECDEESCSQTRSCEDDCDMTQTPCEWAEWGAWGPCTACDGTQSRTRRPISGMCDTSQITETRPCLDEECGGSPLPIILGAGAGLLLLLGLAGGAYYY